MLDDYSLRLLAEIGIDVYVPRGTAAEMAKADDVHGAAPVSTASTQIEVPAMAQRGGVAQVLILRSQAAGGRLEADLLRALRMARVEAELADVDQLADIAVAEGLIVLGESLARKIGAGLSAQRQNEITWIVAQEPDRLAGSADGKRALWGEFKRLARAQSGRSRQH